MGMFLRFYLLYILVKLSSPTRVYFSLFFIKSLNFKNMLNLLLLLDSGIGLVGAGIGAGIVALGVGIGIGQIGGSSVSAIARQPDAAGKVQTAMIIAAALIEGVA